jgi:GntR family transcriptional regulator of vanillate catabolism
MSREAEGSQTRKAELALRQAIVEGEFRAGERLSELTLTERFGVSRTPVRAALARAEAEGLIETLPSGGYVVRAFSEADLTDAIDLRGVLEGFAARRAAERGPSRGELAEAKLILAGIDKLLTKPEMSAEDFDTYVDLNARFHRALWDLAQSPTIFREVERVAALPFASPSGFVRLQAHLPEARAVVMLAQDHHTSVIEAIEAREGARAEALMREHARLARRNLQAALADRGRLDELPGGPLIRHAASL